MRSGVWNAGGGRASARWGGVAPRRSAPASSPNGRARGAAAKLTSGAGASARGGAGTRGAASAAALASSGQPQAQARSTCGVPSSTGTPASRALPAQQQDRPRPLQVAGGRRLAASPITRRRARRRFIRDLPRVGSRDPGQRAGSRDITLTPSSASWVASWCEGWREAWRGAQRRYWRGAPQGAF